jgi:DNA-binding MarR family transcriptional regulator
MENHTAGGSALTQVVIEIFRLNRLLLEAGDGLAAGVGLTSARWQVMGIVEHGPATVSDVARTMGLTRQSVQQTANGLAEEGFIEFADNPRHRRAKLMVITKKGEGAMDYLGKRQREWANGLAGDGGAERLQDAAELLAELRSTLDSQSPGAVGHSLGGSQS